MVFGMTSSPAPGIQKFSPAASLQSVMVTCPLVVVHVRSAKLAALRGRNAQVKSARRAWIGFMA